MKTQLLKNALLAIQKISIADLAEMASRPSSPGNAEISILYPESIGKVFENLNDCFACFKGQFLGTDDILTRVVNAMRDNIELLDHELFSKISILINYAGNTNAYELTALYAAGVTVRYEQGLGLNSSNLSDTDKKTIEEDEAQQIQMENEIQGQMNRLQDKTKLETKCLSYMESLADLVYCEKILKNPEKYQTYLASLGQPPLVVDGAKNPLINGAGK